MAKQAYDYVICDYPIFEQRVVEVYIEGEYVALISQEEGPDKLKIELPRNVISDDHTCVQFDLNAFQTRIEQARKMLIGDG
ncbi:hypothetical protein Pse7367_1484 [Thalassoporum mexicanum PCC 7367]|uniref:hypothetical protein n=1 Tax=Thalassoporum mexicanum TaxID=3457544 RepID=UPI00029FBEBD|nr:hypothetical protein [Pseudanabaena sp. PCC 7367]AFY69774.1 hypothetical protein Pse7367_1484 [Pseudanabaena sp. PCC 7367]